MIIVRSIPGVTRQQAFTLIELLAAMAIFTLLAVAMYGGTQWIILEREIILERQGELHCLQRAVRYIDDDFAQLRPRPVRDELGRDLIPALLAGPGNDFIVELSHDGWRNPAGAPRGTLQRTRYRLEESKLTREYWPVMDRILGQEGRVQELCDGIESLELAYLDEGGEWQELWPPLAAGGTVPAALPLAVRYRLATLSFGLIERIVEVPQ